MDSAMAAASGKNNQAAVMALLSHQLMTHGPTATTEEASRARSRFTKGYAPLSTSSWFSRFPAAPSSSSAKPSRKGPSAAGCPMHVGEATSSASSSTLEKLNPLNQMPTLSQGIVSAAQRSKLSTERVVSSIPRAVGAAAPGASPYDAPVASACPVPHDARGGASTAGASSTKDDTNWEYPSAQQFYNALVRKGWSTPEEHVETMVLIHNFLNERAWQEVCAWERQAGFDPESLSLARFTGRPGTLSPRARLLGWAGWAMPSMFSDTPPFDRHDWIVRRPNGEEVRYIIDYYSDEGEDEEGVAFARSGGAMGAVPDAEAEKRRAAKAKVDEAARRRAPQGDDEEEEKDEAEFTLDVRPALDSFGAARLRLRRTWAEWREGEEKAAAAAAATSSA